MKVKELKEIINNANDDNEVVVRINNPGDFICPDGAFVNVKTAYAEGIDWHFGLTEIIHENRLNVANVENWSHRKSDYDN